MVIEVKDWPFVYGKYVTGNKKSCVAIVTTFNVEKIKVDLEKAAIIGKLTTEDIGIEKLIENIITNPNIRFLILVGRKNLATQALSALEEFGVDQEKRIVNATSKKAHLKNISKEFIERFRKQVKIIHSTKEELAKTIDHCAKKNPGHFEGKSIKVKRPKVIDAERNKEFIIDPAGYFLVRVDKNKKKIVVEHIRDNKTNLIILGKTNEEIRDTVSRLKLIGNFKQTIDHAAYIGREAYKAELALKYDLEYEQDEPLDIKEAIK